MCVGHFSETRLTRSQAETLLWTVTEITSLVTFQNDYHLCQSGCRAIGKHHTETQLYQNMMCIWNTIYDIDVVILIKIYCFIFKV